MNPLEEVFEQKKAAYEQMRAQEANCGIAAACCEKQEATRERLQRQLRNSNQAQVRLVRVLDILERHPEFEEFLEVLRSDLV